MLPFLNNKAYSVHPFPYNTNYDSFRQPYTDANPYIYHFANPNFSLPYDNTFPNHFQYPQMPYLFHRNIPYDHNAQADQRKSKRITKKLALAEVKKKIRASNAKFKGKKNNFKYFDPSRAPPITSLRNDQELVKDLTLKLQKNGFCESNQQKVNLKEAQVQRKLQVLLEEPDSINYPFLICKKRKYHRNLKRRYSVAYFEQRATYIVNKQQIPSSLHPKNKVRKSRTPKNNLDQVSESSENSISSDSFSSSSENGQKVERSNHEKNGCAKIEKKSPFNMKQMKQEIESQYDEVQC